MSQKGFAVIILSVVLLLILSLAVFSGATARYLEPDGVCPLCGKTHDGGVFDMLAGCFHYVLSLPLRFIEDVGGAFGGEQTETTYPYYTRSSVVIFGAFR